MSLCPSTLFKRKASDGMVDQDGIHDPAPKPQQTQPQDLTQAPPSSSAAAAIDIPSPPTARRRLSKKFHQKIPQEIPQEIAAPTATTTNMDPVKEYQKKRQQVLQTELDMSFEGRCRKNAAPGELLADQVLSWARREDQKTVYDKTAPRVGFGGQKHDRFAGDHFLANEPLISQTKLFAMAQRLPKGGHLHIHFNACLQPHVLLDIAAQMPRMFIMSDRALVDAATTHSFALAEITFSVCAEVEVQDLGNLFDRSYGSDKRKMLFSAFLAQFPQQEVGMSAMQWLQAKLVFQADEAYDAPQTAEGAWARFNKRTRMMKGLFNYKTAFKTYVKLFLEDLKRDNIQYAEIRPNFMKTNQLMNDDGTKLENAAFGDPEDRDNAQIVQIIVDAVEEFKTHNKDFTGVKIIYCVPRSFEPTTVGELLDQCLRFKQRWPEYIAGFDLVGEESAGKPLSDFLVPLLAFQEHCKAAGVSIPFLFHCGETLAMGTSTDGNLVDALLLDSRRIGHGFALPRHPHVMHEMKARRVCVELCPISNEVLGLTPRVGGHAAYTLLANNVPCTVSSDNGTLFKSTLSHDFYQLLVGKSDMSLFGWRQLVEWSLEHACLTDQERQRAHTQWLAAWRVFVVHLLEEYGPVAFANQPNGDDNVTAAAAEAAALVESYRRGSAQPDTIAKRLPPV